MSGTLLAIEDVKSATHLASLAISAYDRAHVVTNKTGLFALLLNYLEEISWILSNNCTIQSNWTCHFPKMSGFFLINPGIPAFRSPYH